MSKLDTCRSIGSYSKSHIKLKLAALNQSQEYLPVENIKDQLKQKHMPNDGEKLWIMHTVGLF